MSARPPDTGQAGWAAAEIRGLPGEQVESAERTRTRLPCMLERLLRHRVVVVAEGESFRLRRARAKGAATRTTQPRNK
jgi:hypothetical protein